MSTTTNGSAGTNPDKTWHLGKNSLKRLTGILVITMYVLFLSGLFIGFSAYISRTSITTASETSLDEILHKIEEFQSTGERYSDAQAKILEHNSNISKTLLKIENKHLEIRQLGDKTHSTISTQLNNLLTAALEPPPGASKDGYALRNTLEKKMLADLESDRAAVQKYYFLPFDLTRKFTITISTRPAETVANPAQIAKHKKTILDQLASYQDQHQKLRSELLTFEHELTSFSNAIDDEEERMVAADKERAQIANQITPKNWAIISSLDAFNGLLLVFVKMPTIILTLMVTIAAGGLASVVSFTRKFLHDTEAIVGTSRLLSSVGEGIAASIGIFLFAGTGMLMLTQGAQGVENRAELSPYMVAFIAFLSGFMAESAFERIEAYGRRLFHGDNGNGDGGQAPNGNNGSAPPNPAPVPAPDPAPAPPPDTDRDRD